jgi:protein-tyrosine phosphatase
VCPGRSAPSRTTGVLAEFPHPTGRVEEWKLRETSPMSFDRTLDESALFRICFVCTGNICRSPMAEAVFKELVRNAGLDSVVAVISAGTGDWHVGEPSDDRTVTALAARGLDGTRHRAKQFDPDWFENLDLIVGFDRSHERILRAWASNDIDRSKVQLLMSFDSDASGPLEVPDPYYSDAALFDLVLAMIEKACGALFRQVSPGIPKPHAIPKETS